MDDLEGSDDGLQESVEPTYVDLYVAAVAQDDEEALEGLLQFAAVMKDFEQDSMENYDEHN